MKLELYYDEPIRIFEIMQEDISRYEYIKNYYSLLTKLLEENAPKNGGCLRYTPEDVKLDMLQKMQWERKTREQGFGEFNHDYSDYRRKIDKYTYRKE